jgi:hypothetical protein
MANPGHLAILNQGVEAWNKWREENPDVKPDLSWVKLIGTKLSESNLCYADLSGVDLSSADLSRAKLIGAKLIGADFIKTTLNRADLSNTDLRGACLSDADIIEATLIGANFSKAILNGADLSRAKLTGAKLTGVDFTRADCTRANFSEAIIGFTTFGDIDLSTVIGLDKVRHEGPTTIGIDTLFKSQGNIPEIFLRGCGVPDQMIEYVHSLTSAPIEYYSCFISYSHKDEKFARRLWEGLQINNVRCWYAPHDMKIGDKIRPVIDDSIRVYDKLLLILSEHSVQSDWVEHEVEHALDIEREKKKNMLFPVRLDDAIMDSKYGWAGNIKRQRHIGDFTQWKDHDAYQKTFDRLLRDLKAG